VAETIMKVYQKWEDMADYLYIGLKSYPKSERFTLAADTSHALWKIGINITRANSIGNAKREEKRRCIEAADYAMVELKVLVRMGMRLKFLPIKKYEMMSGFITEVGKMIGGWLKTLQ
jgi:four helix bundle protein